MNPLRWELSPAAALLCTLVVVLLTALTCVWNNDQPPEWRENALRRPLMDDQGTTRTQTLWGVYNASEHIVDSPATITWEED